MNNIASVPKSIEAVATNPIPEFPGYRAGEDGSVWSAWRRGAFGKCSIDENRWKPLQPYRLKSGHLMVYLRRNGLRHPRLVHRLVLEAFVGPCPEGMEACHFPDRNPSNNCLTNLRWDTASANSLDAIAHKTKQVGQDHPNAKLTSSQVAEIRIRFANGETKACLARQFGIHKKTVRMIVLRQTWKHDA